MPPDAVSYDAFPEGTITVTYEADVPARGGDYLETFRLRGVPFMACTPMELSAIATNPAEAAALMCVLLSRATALGIVGQNDTVGEATRKLYHRATK